MHILHVSESFASGTLEVIRTLSNRLVAEGHAVTVAYGARPETPADVAALFDPRVELLALPWRRRTLRAQVAAGRALRRLVADLRPNVVHLHSSFAGAVGAAALGGRRPGSARLVYTPHGSALLRHSDGRLQRTGYRLVERFVARRVSVIGAVSKAEARVARTLRGQARVEVVPNGLPELDERGTPAPEPRPAPLVVGMGRLGAARPAASVARILGALRDVATPMWIGDAIRPEDAAVLREHGVEVTGWLDRELALEQLAAATACLHWSAWDGQAMVILEALALDVVAIASDVEANREVLGDAQVCADEDEAVALLRSIVEDPAVREVLLRAQRGRRAAYGAQRMTDSWLRLYTRESTRAGESAESAATLSEDAQAIS
ncbi:MAG TPA: glycosyltransferase [Solirubrobacteraceae bacterium]|nr:glycosyltransferase [Solirubrobacteraceae bacterium]